jgi:hypothetical protein
MRDTLEVDGGAMVVASTRPRKRGEVAVMRLRLAERLLIGAAADRPELLTDDNWQHAMAHVYAMLKKVKR